MKRLQHINQTNTTTFIPCQLMLQGILKATVLNCRSSYITDLFATKFPDLKLSDLSVYVKHNPCEKQAQLTQL